MKFWTFAVALFVLRLSGLAAIAAQEEKPAPEAKEESLVAERADLQVVIEADGTIEPVKRKKLKVVPEEFPGPYTVLEIVESGRTVETGAVLVRLETNTLERLIRGAQEGLEAAKMKAQTTREELENLKTANRLKLERMGLDLKQAERDLNSFGKYGDEQLLEGRALGLKHQEFYLSNREQELAQLEKMYKDAQLSSETKEIVLERARREVALGKESLTLAKKSEKQLKEFEEPSQKDKLNNTAEQKKQDFDLAGPAIRLAETQKSEELKAAERALRDAEERLHRLKNDLAQMELKSPFAGVFRHAGIEAGDKVNPNAGFADLLELAHFEVHFLVTLKELQPLHVGDAIKVTSPDLPELQLGGKIEELALTAWPEPPDKPITHYMVRAKVDEDKQLRHGARLHVQIPCEKLKKVIVLPRTAVFVEEGRTYCKVHGAQGVAKREIVVGLGDRERLSVLRGLSEGETVVIKEGKK
jgi:multidrug efflux pump subunit AcrA (membrane-fusion protein)